MSIDSRRQALFEERLRAAGVRVADSGPAAGPRPERIPLSSAQQRFWVLEQLDPGNPALHMAAPVRLRGPLSADALGRGLNALVARHEVLRTVIETDPDGTGRQRVRPAADCPLPVVDLAGTPSGERAARLATISDEEARRPFDLRQGPLLRARLVRLDADDHVLLLTLHHIAGDGWSVGVLVDELAQLYRGAGPLAPLPLQYADFALWERQHLADAEQTAALDRVAGRLTGAPVLELPTDAPRGAVRTYRGARREWRADRALSQAVHRLSRQAGVSPFVVLLAGLTVVLSRQAGTDDVVVGAPVAGRHRPETAGLIGCFVNTVALRADLSGDPSFSALLHRVRDASLEAYAHQHVPFEAVLRRLHADRDPGRTPLFDVLVNMVDVPGGPVTLAPGLTAELGEPQEVGVKFDLTLYLRDLPAGFEFVASYNADLFGGARIEALLRQCGAVLAAATSAPQRRINRFDLRTPLPQLPRPGAPREPGPALLHERFSTVAARHPGRTALVTPTGDWSYRTLESRANQVAQALHARGARPGDPVAVHARRGPGLVAALLGVLKAGATVGVVDPDAPPAAVAQCLTVLRPAVVVDTTGGTVPGVPPAGVLALPDDAPWPLAGLADTVPDGIRSHPDDPAYVFFTSGTTGAAKAVTGTHRPVAHFLDVQRETFGLTATDRFALLAGLGHDPLLRDVFAPLSLGAPLCVPGPAPLGEQQDLAAWLDTAGVTVAHLTPALARFVVATSLSGSLPLRYAFLGGEAISATDVARLAAIAPGVRCVSVYGTTETPQVMTWQEVRADGPARPPIGTGIDGVTVRLLNPAGEPCGVGELGELFLETPWLTLGYRDRPGLTADRFRPAHDPATPGARGYATGDLGRLGPDGSIVYSGRADRQLSVDGHRVEPAEIEAVLATHPGVREVTVTADRIAHVAAGTGMDGSGLADELRLLAARRLPRHLRPAGYAVHERLPRTNHGKLDHRALTATAPRVAEGQAPRTAPERLIAERMAAVLGVPVFSDTDFFAAGGDSLQAMRLVRELGERGHEVALAAVFECPSPALLAPRLGDGGATPDRPRPRPAGEVVPLSWAQQRLWFLDQLHPGSTAYNIPITIAIDGPLDTHRLTHALNTTIQRHEALRTTIDPTTEPPTQHIHPHRPTTITTHPDPPTPQPFDLTTGPLLRANLSTHTPHHHTLTITLHHTIADAWSVTVLANELQAHYQGIPLPAPAVQYADHTRWQQSRVDLTAELRHWAAVLADLAVQDLPTDHARRDTGDAPAARHYFRLPPALSDRVTDFGRQAEATPFMVVLAALQTVLTHHTGQTDIAIATPTAGRHHPDLDHTIGYFANTLVLRTHTNHNPTFHQLLNRTRTTCLTAYHHDTTPFEHIVETLNPHRDPTRHPLTQTMLAWQNAPVAALRIDGLELEVLPAENGTAQFDLSFVLAEDDGGIGGYLEYRSDLFDQATARRFAAHLTAVLATALNDPQRRVAELVPMTPAERHDLLVSWNGTATVPDSPDVADLVARAASADPDATAVTADRRQWSYAELERGANRLAHRLVELGAGPERLVGLLLEPGAPMVVAMLAVLRSGAAYLPLDPGGPAARRTDLLAEARPAVLLTTAALAGRVPTGAGCPVLRLDADATTIDRQPDTAPAHTGGPDNLAYVMYTSGSTGRPKGVAISRHSLARLLATARDWVTSGPGDVWTVLHSYAFDLSVWEIWAALTTGGRLIVVPPEVGQDGARLLRLLADERVTMLNITPSAFRYLESADAAAPAGLALRHIMFAGEAVDLATVTAWFARRGDRTPRLHTMYGPTEATVHATSYPLGERDLGADRTPIGRPLRDLGVHVLDSAGRLAPVGAVGDLHLGGAALARGYLGGPALTADRFRPDPFGGRPGARLYRTGDLARWRTDGVLEFHGRVDDQVQIRGVRIEPGEVRAELARLPGVAQAAVVARLEADGDHRLIGYVVPVRGGALDPAELRRRLADVLPSHLVPAVLVILDALPLTRNGKLDRAALPAPRPADPPPVAPRSPVGAASGAQQVLAHLWAEVLGVPEVGPEDDFFDLSGHSLAAARLLAKVRAVFDVDLPIRVLFDAPTVNGLLTEIDRARRAVLPTPRPRPAGQVVPLSWAQQRLWFLDQLHPGSTAYNIPITIAIDGPLDTHRLTHALNTTIQRHEALRTTIDPTTEPPTQHIHPHRPTTITTHPDPPTPQPFDLTTGPLLRANLSTHTPHHHTLTITLHHTIADAWSVTVLIQELVAHYQGRSLPVPALQYADHTHWQQTHLDLTAELRHWATTLADLPVLRIPTDRPRSDWDDRGATVELPLPDHVRTGVEQLARKSGSTPFMVVLAALQTVLTHHTGQTDIAIATPTAGRHHPDLDHTIGYFANTLVLRTHTNHNPTFHQLLNRTRTTCLTAYHHDTTPFEHIVETLNPHRDPTRHPLTQTMLAWQEPPAVPAEVDGLRLTPLDPPVTTAKFDLLFSVTELPQEWLAGLSYRTALFDRATAQRLLANLRQVLEQAIADPDRPIGDLDALTAADHALSADAGTGSAQRHPTHRTVAELFTEQAARTPGAVAVTAAAGALTYADLDRRTNQLARYLRSRGVGPETRVGVAGDRGLDLVVSLLAVLKAGGCYVPLDPANPPARRQRIARDAGVALVLDGTGADWPELAVVDPAAETVTAQDDGDLTPSAGPDNLAYVLYTSGSTGTPKGVMISNAALTNHMCWMARRWPLTPADRVLQKTPIGFDASVWEFYAPLLAGAGLVLAEPDGHRDNAYLVDAIRTHDITVLQVVPSLLDVLLDTPGFGTASPLRRVFSGGEALTPRLRDAFLDAMDADLVNLYGPAECCVDSTSADCRDSHGSPVVPIGRPIDNARAYVLGPRLRPVPPGAPGELYLAGPGLGRGYLGRPDLTAERFLPDPFAAEPGSRMYATGDLARVTGDGHLEHLGRIDRQLTLHGHRIEPAEIEAVLARHPAVRRVAVTADLTAHVVPRSGRSIELADLHRHAAGELPAYLRPTGIRRHDELPLTPNGKVDHAALTGLAAETPEVRGEAPRGPAEEAVAEAYASVLGRPVGDRNANFFHSGGNSLLAMRVVARLAAAGHPVALQQVFTHPTPAELAGVLGGDGTDRIPAVPAGRPVPATHAQRRIWFLHQVRPDRTDHHIPTVVRLRGPLDPAALRRAFAELVVRHEPLRTGFAYRDGALWQVPGDPAGPDLPVEDVGGPDAADAAVRESVDRPFDLAAGPLLRARLLRTRPDDHLLIAVLQHIAVDGWSIGILLRDLAELYAAARDGRAARLPELPVRYADYAAWQAGRSAPGQLQESLTYWPERLAGLGAPGLPKRIPVPAATADRPGASVPLDIERELRDAVFALAASAGTTPFAVLLGVLALVLARRTGRPDICIGTDVADRDRPELADLAGLFLNQVPLRMDVSGVTTFRALLGRAATTSREALAHSQVPFDRIVDAARAGRAPGAAATPLFSVLLGYEEGGLPDRFGDLAAEFTELPAGTTKLDLTLFTWNGSGGLTGRLQYATDVLDHDEARTLRDDLLRTLRTVTADPDAPLTPTIPSSSAPGGRAMAPVPSPRFRRVTPRPVPVADTGLIRTGEVIPGSRLPLLATPESAGVDLTGWLASRPDWLPPRLAEHGAVLFRGFGVHEPASFERLAGTVCGDLLDANGEHVPVLANGRVQTPVFFPADRRLLWHNENSFNDRWPALIVFCSTMPAASGGETPLVDSRRVYAELSPAIRERFLATGVRYHRSYGGGVGLDWAKVFGTDDRAEVERACRDAGLRYEWQPGNRLRTTCVRPAVVEHPVTGEPSWFTQAQHWHPACLDPVTRTAMTALYGPEDLPRNCTYGDGEPIPDEVMTEILGVYERLEVSFAWQRGDVLVVDNVLTAHGRNPYQGERRLLVALGRETAYPETAGAGTSGTGSPR